MDSLFTINELFTNGYKTEVLNIISLLTILSGIYVIISKNPIISVLFLIGLFSGISCYLILIGLSFIGLSYLIIYIGAVSILFLFILMLINIRISELQNNNKNSIPLALFIVIFCNYSIFQILPYNITMLNNYNNYLNDILYSISLDKFNKNFLDKNKTLEINNSNLSFVSGNNWDGNLVETNHISNIGSILYTNYNIWIIITSFILLLAMVGAIIITIKQK